MNRRSFLSVTAASLAATRLAPWLTGAAPLDRIGVQLFSLPKMLERDYAGAFAMLATLGYKEVEFFGPYSFSPEAVQQKWIAGAGDLGFSGSGWFGHTAKETRALLDRHGLSAPSMHVDLDTLLQRPTQVGEAAQAMGHSYAGIASIPDARRKTLDDYRRMADVLNDIGRRGQPYGFKALYHNHGYGLSPMEGQIPLHVLVERLDPSLVSLEMDLFWTMAGGADPVALLDAYPRHYRLMHVKDATKRVRFSGNGGDRSQWIPLFPYMTTAGNGVLELPRILSRARSNGVAHFYVEQDLAPEPEKALGASIGYLRTLELAAK